MCCQVQVGREPVLTEVTQEQQPGPAAASRQVCHLHYWSPGKCAALPADPHIEHSQVQLGASLHFSYKFKKYTSTLAPARLSPAWLEAVKAGQGAAPHATCFVVSANYISLHHTHTTYYLTCKMIQCHNFYHSMLNMWPNACNCHNLYLVNVKQI